MNDCPEGISSAAEDDDNTMDIGASVPVYKHRGHTDKAFSVLNMLRKQSQLCDIVLVADGYEIGAHKAVLAACSNYFYAMFTGDLVEARANRVPLQDIDSKTLIQLIDFVYTSEIHVNEDNVQALLPAARLLQMTDVCDACCDFLQSQLHPSNCLGIKAFADLHACQELRDIAQNYTEQHFGHVVQYEEYLNLPVNDVCCLIASDCLTVPTEEQVFEAVIAWVNYKLDCRQEQIAILMEHVRLPLLSQEYLVQRVEEEYLVKQNTQCKDYLIEAMKYHLVKPEQKILFKTTRTKLRTPLGLPKILLVIGGQAPKAIKSVECYDFKEEKWSQLSEMRTRRCRCGIAVVGNLLYVVGGFNGSQREQTVVVYDLRKDQWSDVSPMNAKRSTLGVALLENIIYAVGGFDGTFGLKSVEAYNPLCNEWRFVSPMSTPRSSVGVGVINNQLFAVGGYDGSSRHCLSTVECYNPPTDEWKLVAEMTCRRSGAGVAVLDGLLYAVGGHDGPQVRKTVEVYHSEQNAWTEVCEMHTCRRNAGVVTHNNKLYVVGGDDGNSNLSSVEIYDPKTNEWTLLDSCMSMGRSYSGVCVVDKSQ